MTNEISKKCNKKGCNNPVLDGKYCVSCKQNKKEKRDRILGRVGAGIGLALALGNFALKNDGIKQAPKTVVKAAKVFLKI